MMESYDGCYWLRSSPALRSSGIYPQGGASPSPAPSLVRTDSSNANSNRNGDYEGLGYGRCDREYGMRNFPKCPPTPNAGQSPQQLHYEEDMEQREDADEHMGTMISEPRLSMSAFAPMSLPATPEPECRYCDFDVPSYDVISRASHMTMSEFRRKEGTLNWKEISQKVQKSFSFPCQTDFSRHSVKVNHPAIVGRGGSSSVYAAISQEKGGFKDTFAVKILHGVGKRNAQYPPEELRIMESLKHNHIAALVGSFQQDDILGVLIYPLAECNLAQYMQAVSCHNLECRNIPHQRVPKLLTALACLSSALLYMHDTARVKHKDIKPENILVDRHGSMLFTDFGISKKYDNICSTITEGPTAFTQKYAAPEVASQGPRGLEADIFSLGCVFLEIATLTLGLSLAVLDKMLFHEQKANSIKPAYHRSLGKVAGWITELKRHASRRELNNAHRFSYDETIAPGPGGRFTPSNNDITTDLFPNEKHLDLILRMLSPSPKQRPPMKDLYGHFAEFAEGCLECQVSSSTTQAPHMQQSLSTNSESSSASIYKDSELLWDLEPECISYGLDCSQQFEGNIPQDSYYTNNSKQLLSCPMTSNEFSKGVFGISEPPLERFERSPSFSDTESEASVESEDSDTLDGYDASELKPFKEVIEDIRLEIVRLWRNSKYDLSIPKYTTHGSGSTEESSTGGSNSTNPPAKRRSSGTRRTQYSSEDLVPTGNDDGETGLGIAVSDVVAPETRRAFACPYHRRNPTKRQASRACGGPGWLEIHRVKYVTTAQSPLNTKV